MLKCSFHVLVPKIGLKPDRKLLDMLKDQMMSDIIVRLPGLSKQFLLKTDASDTGRAMLLQGLDGAKHPVTYTSHKTYSTSEKECLTFDWAIRKFENYLYGRTFVIKCDHQPLAFLSQAKYTDNRLMRWSLFLTQCDVNIRCIKGNMNVSDYMSCRQTELARLRVQHFYLHFCYKICIICEH